MAAHYMPRDKVDEILRTAKLTVRMTADAATREQTAPTIVEEEPPHQEVIRLPFDHPLLVATSKLEQDTSSLPDAARNALRKVKAGGSIDEIDNAFAILLPMVGPAKIDQALDAALETRYLFRYSLAATLRSLGPHLATEQLKRALDLALGGESRPWDEEALSGLSGSLPASLAREGIQKLLAREPHYMTSKLAGLLASCLETAELRRTLASVRHAKDYYRDDLAAALLQGADPSLLDEVLASMRSPEGFFAGGARFSDQFMDTRLLEKLLDALSDIQVITSARELMSSEPDYHRAEKLVILARRFQPDLFEEALTYALAIEDASIQRQLLGGWAPILAPPLLQRAVAFCVNLPNVSERVAHIDALLPAMSETDRATAVRQVYGLALEIHDEPFQVVALAGLGQSPGPSGADEPSATWAAMLERTNVRDNRAVCDALIALLPRVEESKGKASLLRAIKSAPQLTKEMRSVVWVLAALVRRLNVLEAQMVVRQALDVIANVQNEDEDAYHALSAVLLFSPHLAEKELALIVSETDNYLSGTDAPSDAVKGDRDTFSIIAVAVMRAVAPRMPTAEAKRAITIALKMSSEAMEGDERAIFPLLLLSSHLTADQCSSILAQLLEDPATIRVKLDPELEIVHSALIPYLEDGALYQLGMRALQRLPRMTRMEALAMLALMEGGWGDPLSIRPAVASHALSRSFLERLGGPQAVAETISAVQKVASWWP